MIALPQLIALNEKAAAGQLIRRDNFNRDSSLVKTRGCYVIHSGIHRSTLFVDPAEYPDTFHCLTYWKEQGQAALNAVIETLVDGGSPEQADAEAFRRTRPEWTVRPLWGTGQSAGVLIHITAIRRRGRLEERQAATNYRWLHHRTA